MHRACGAGAPTEAAAGRDLEPRPGAFFLTQPRPWALGGLEAEDLAHEAGLLHLNMAGEADHPPTGGPLNRGAEGRPDRLLELGADFADGLPLALADQELLVGEQLQAIE